MRQRVRIATAVGAIGAVCLLLIPLAGGAGAAAPTVEDYQMTGVARGISFGFAFKDFVIPKVLDIGVPYASNELNTSAGASAMSEAAEAFPGDVLVGALQPQFPGGIPGYSVSKYPPGQSENKNVTSSLFGNEIPLPTSAGPLAIDNGHLETLARERQASSSTTTQRLIFGDALAPLFTIGSISSMTDSKALSAGVTQLARTAINDLVITPSADLTIKIGSLVSQATTSSDGETAQSKAGLTLSDVRVISGTTVYSAAIDNKGLHITGAPEGVPGTFEQPLGGTETITNRLANSGVSIRTADAIEAVEGATGEASMGGLILVFSGEVPRVPGLQPTIAQILSPITEQIPTQCGLIPNFPVCLSPQLIPTGGTGTITSISIGSVDSVSTASAGFVETPIGGGTGGFGPGGVGGFSPELPGGGDFGNGGTLPGTGPTAQPGQQRLFGLVARMPAGALLGGGLTFLVIAIAMTIGPSLRRWRAT